MSKAERLLVWVLLVMVCVSLGFGMMHPRGIFNASVTARLKALVEPRLIAAAWNDLERLSHEVTAGGFPDTIFIANDYRCPGCKAVHAAVTDPEQGFASVRHINLPLVSLHPDADTLALVSICASYYGEFASVHDRLMGLEPEDHYNSALEGLGDLEQAITACLPSARARTRLESEVSLAKALRIGFTPAVVSRERITRGLEPPQP